MDRTLSQAAHLNLIGKKKKFRHSSNSSATSKAAAGRKNRMLANRAAAFTNSPQAVQPKMDEKSSSQLLPKVSCRKEDISNARAA